MTTLTLPAPAKLNLFLHITGQRSDGYHELQTLFQFIDVCDQLSFTLTDDDQIALTPAIAGVAFESNLIVKAARLLEPYKSATSGVSIQLKKVLPMGGGIGGGSSDAATTLLALNQLWQCQLPLDKLAELGKTLGADVPIFVFGHAAYAEGIGEKLTQTTPETPYYVLLKPNCEVPTVQIFTDKYLTRDTPAIRISHALKLDGHNDCLEVVRRLYPEVDDAFIWLSQFGEAKLTGTGACLFMACSSKEEAERVKAAVPEKWQTWVCHGCNTSPAHDALNQWIAAQH
ncbi:4-(cytidine 5'-diphospho)-2-C-methyl-D-erythritol kinase [Marinomonas ostreistagni]|uniref:4-(cytidine 5'-diphospho)-2-C-methyl-D-erythritol kinase n=1 Tax=Marinomonas ostreistagni TaxID=359209 RepID=UPI0019512092|nr:4-(cytidine 5'-diphospho)-2-C-methyl-D-erythritol kinase [Marinomonas ostreistagni]MBM6551601.1 4-(cytidine 5'-diphospho)-2-C-methyl-D-erythritol kinase [Marinomonas ostreistagni]